ncbi:MAG: NlpC/P60 family protein [Nocardioidaceae bacterium]
MRSGLKNSIPVRLSVATCAVLTLGLTAVPSSSVATPDPSLSEVEDRVDAAYHAAEQASERYNAIAEDMVDTKTKIKGLEADVARQNRTFSKLRKQVGATVADELTSSPMGPTTQLLTSDDPDEFLGRLSALQSYNSSQADALAAYETRARELGVRKDQLRSTVAVLEAAKKDAAKEEATLDDNAAEAEALLAALTQAQREAVEEAAAEDAAAEDAAVEDAAAEEPAAPEAAPSTPSTPSVDASGRAAAAVEFAMAQVGDAYVYGAAGPNSWDCSGLTMGAYGAAGVSLPHSSSAQAGMGSAVSTSAMSPGDLVFYYSPISHVGIYIGNGQLVHAANPSRPVEIVPVNSMSITAVRRVG